MSSDDSTHRPAGIPGSDVSEFDPDESHDLRAKYIELIRNKGVTSTVTEKKARGETVAMLQTT